MQWRGRVAAVALVLIPLGMTANGQTAKSAPPKSVMSASDAAAFRRAVAAYETGRADEAQATVQRLAGQYPANVDVQALEGMLLAGTGKIEEAIAYLAKAHKLDATNDTIAANLGLAYLKLGRANDAVEPLQAACRIALASFADRVALAQAFLGSQRYDDAARTFEKAATLQPDGEISSAELHAQWAQALLLAGRAADAATMLRAQPELATNDNMQSLLGEAEEKNGRYEAAFEAYKRAAQLAPTASNIDAYGAELLRHWAFPEAGEVYRFGAERFPASTRMKIGQGTAYFGNNDFTNAAGVFGELLKQNPEDRSAADMLGRSCSAELAHEIAACDGLVAFATAHPQNASAALYAAITLMHRGASEASDKEAEALLQSSLKADPKLAEAWYQMGCLQQSRTQWAESATSLEKAIALQPAFAEAHYRLARAYARTGRRDESQQQIALQQRYSGEAKEAERQRMKDVITFITKSH